MTEYKEINGSIVADFAQRTLANLKFIEDNKENPDVYEVTQLINSMLGFLVFPKEEFWNNIKAIPLEDIPEARVIYQDLGNRTDLRELVRCLRNSISHFNVSLKPEKGFIEYIEMWNVNRNGDTNWRAIANVFELRRFVLYFINGIIDGALLETEKSLSE